MLYNLECYRKKQVKNMDISNQEIFKLINVNCYYGY